jgi:hypothetical protein
VSRELDYQQINDFNPGNLEIEAVDKAAFSSDASLVAVSTITGTIEVLERQTKTRIQRIDGLGRAHAMRFSDDDRFLEVVTGGGDLRIARYFILPTSRLLEEACRRSTRKSFASPEWQGVVGQAPTYRPCTGADAIAIP